MKQQPALTLRQNSNPYIEGYGRQNAKREHPPPISTASKHGVHDIREQDAHRNGKLNLNAPFRKRIAPEMTPVSKPNRSPASAAIAAVI
jgi:hypothetical protein